MRRRDFVTHLVYPATGLVLGCATRVSGDPRHVAGLMAAASADPQAAARDESLWVEVQRAFTPDRSIVNFNNGGVCPSPRIVQEAMKLDLDHANTAPAWVLWQLQDPGKETVRAGLARLFGCDPEEVAITRNASEGLEILQLGLDLEAGDEILTTDMDYPRMITTWRQRERRDGVVLKQIPVPVPAEDDDAIVDAFARALTPRTKVIHVCHVINLNGQVMPVRRLVELGRQHGARVIVDGAHSFAHLDFAHADLDCDYFATSLHKFLFAPHGTGMLFVRRARIPEIWPLMPAPPEMDADIRKFEEIGTHPSANRLGIADAIAFHDGIGPARKQARQLYLRDTWARRLATHKSKKFRLHTSLTRGRASGVANVELVGVPATALAEHLWKTHRIFTVAIEHPRFSGIRVSPTVYNTLDELDRFCAAMEKVAMAGLPA